MAQTDQDETYDVEWHAEELKLYAKSNLYLDQRYKAIEKVMVRRFRKGMNESAINSGKRQFTAWFTTAARAYVLELGSSLTFTKEAIELAAKNMADSVHDDYQFGYYDGEHEQT